MVFERVQVLAGAQFDVEDLAEFAAVDDFADEAIVAVVSSIVMDAEHLARLVGSFDHGGGLGGVEAHGVFDQDVAAVGEGLARQWAVREVGRDEGDHLDIGIRPHILRGVVSADVGEVGMGGVGASGIAVAHTHQPQVRAFLDPLAVGAAEVVHSAVADDDTADGSGQFGHDGNLLAVRCRVFAAVTASHPVSPRTRQYIDDGAKMIRCVLQ